MKYRYSKWDGTQQPFPLDADTVLESISDDLMSHGDLNGALQRLYRWRSQAMPVLDELTRQLQDLRERELSRYDLDSVVEDLKEKLQQQMLDQLFHGMKEPTQRTTSQDLSEVKQMVTAVNQMLQHRANGCNPNFKSLMDRFGHMSAPGIEGLDQLLEQLRRQLAQM